MSRRFEALGVIHAYIMVHGYSPSFGDVMDAMGYSSKAPVHRMMSRLLRDELITMVPGMARTVRVTDKGLIEIYKRGLIGEAT